jgi:hypothetical protein
VRPTPTFFLMSLCICIGFQAVAVEPPAPTASSQPTPVVAAPAGTTLASGDPLPASPPPATLPKSDSAPKNGISEAQIKALRSAGYKMQVRNGQTLFCRIEHQLGTRFESKVCGTAEDIQRSVQNSQEFADKLQQKAFIAPKGSP